MVHHVVVLALEPRGILVRGAGTEQPPVDSVALEVHEIPGTFDPDLDTRPEQDAGCGQLAVASPARTVHGPGRHGPGRTGSNTLGLSDRPIDGIELLLHTFGVFRLDLLCIREEALQVVCYRVALRWTGLFAAQGWID